MSQPLTRCHDEDLGRVLGRQVSTVAVITTCQRGIPIGLLVTSLASVSTQPPVISFSISSRSASWPALEQADYIGVHLLGAGQEALAEQFSPGHAATFPAPPAWQPGPHGVPILDGCAAWTVAQPKQKTHAGGHVIVVAGLLHGDARDGAPLFTHAGTYHQMAS
jgi:flavin reductase (DIM6/NTAB) family NADH-FMN oxidoreductase RutF